MNERTTRDDGPTSLSLAELSDLALSRDLKAVSDLLTERGFVLKAPVGSWNPVSGGLEYSNYVAEHLLVDHLPSTLHVEVSRERDKPEHMLMKSFDLRPQTSSQTEWLEKIRALLSRDFESASPRGGGAEIYKRGTLVEALLFAGSSDESPHLLIRTRGLIRNK